MQLSLRNESIKGHHLACAQIKLSTFWVDYKITNLRNQTSQIVDWRNFKTANWQASNLTRKRKESKIKEKHSVDYSFAYQFVLTRAQSALSLLGRCWLMLSSLQLMPGSQSVFQDQESVRLQKSISTLGFGALVDWCLLCKESDLFTGRHILHEERRCRFLSWPSHFLLRMLQLLSIQAPKFSDQSHNLSQVMTAFHSARHVFLYLK